MKILHLIWALNTGGSEAMLVDILNEQAKTQKVNLMIVNRLESKELADKISKNVTIHRCHRKPGSRNILDLFSCNLKILKLSPDVIHCHNHDLIQFIPIAAKVAAPSLLLTIHSTNVPIYNFSKYHYLFAISVAVQKDVYERSGLIPRTVCNGINTSLIRKKTNYKFSNFRIVQIGRLFHKQKGQDILMESIAYLVHTKKIHYISVDFVGTGPSERHLRDLAERLEIGNYCSFIGLKTREWIYENLCEYNLLVQPSIFEGFGLTVAEAMAAKVPVLVSNIEGPMEIIDNGKYGFKFISKNSHDLAEKIQTIQKKYRTKTFQDKISCGYNHVTESYDIKQTASSYLRHYELARVNLLKRKKFL